MRSAIRILCIFATLWSGAALTYDSLFMWWSIAAFVPAATLFGWTFIGELPERAGADRISAWRIVRRWTIAEGVAMFVTVGVLSALHHSAYSMPAIIAILGLHFVPLAAQLPQRLYYGTAVGCLVIAAIAAVAPSAAHIAMAALATAVVLTLTAVMLTAGTRGSRPA